MYNPDFVTALNNVADKLDKIAERLDLLSKTSNVTAPQPCLRTLHSWLDEWFTTYRAPVLRDNGRALQRVINKHVKPNIPDLPLNDYTPADIQKALNKVEYERMRQMARQVYNQAFREAVRCGLIAVNPVSNVAGVSHKYENGRALTVAEEKQFLTVAKNDGLYPLFRFYLLTGCRPSEPLLIKREDIGREFLHIPGTKTEGADRYIPMFSELQQLINNLPDNNERLFPYCYTTVLRRLHKIQENLNFSFTIKDLRHTFGTRCLQAGVSMKTVQKWLGHSNYNTTANFYSHVSTEFEQTEMTKFNSFLALK